jgi:hypothetical protein
VEEEGIEVVWVGVAGASLTPSFYRPGMDGKPPSPLPEEGGGKGGRIASQFSPLPLLPREGVKAT